MNKYINEHIKVMTAKIPSRKEKTTMKVGDKVKIIDMNGEPSYTGKTGIITHIDDLGQVHGTWGGCALIPNEDIFEVIPTNE